MVLFFPDNHAPDAPTFHPAAARDAERVGSLLARYYPDLEAGPVEVIGDVNINSSNFRVGERYVKVIDEPAGRDYVPRFPGLAAELGGHGIPSGNYLRNVHGEPITVMLGTAGEPSRYLYVQEYLAAGFYTGTAEEFTRCVGVLERLGPALAAVEPTPDQREPYRSWRPLDQIARIDSVVQATAPDADADWIETYGVVRSRLEELSTGYERVRPELDGARLAHHDLHPHNLLFRDGELVAVLDLESFRAVTPQLAIAFALFKLGRKSISLGRMTVPEYRAIAAARFDLAALRPFAEFEVLRRLLYLFDQKFLHGTDRWPAELRKQLAGLDEISALFG